MRANLARRSLFGATVAIAISGCNGEDAACVGAGRPGLNVAVSDSRTKRDLTEFTFVTATALRGRDGYQVSGYGNAALRTTYGSRRWSVRFELAGYRTRTDTIDTSAATGCVFEGPTILRVELDPEM